MESITNKPWGNFQIIEKGTNYLVKKITVFPKGKLSLQTHQHRSENWIIIDGNAEVIIDDEKKELRPKQSIFIPNKAKHSLANLSAQNLILIEVWHGEILDEEDITRHEDIYGRI